MSEEALYKDILPDEDDVGLTLNPHCDDGREIAVLNHIHQHPSIDALRGNPLAIAEAMDEFARKQDFLMTIGPAKRKIITSIMSSSTPKPKTFLEFGSYVGYSALALGSALRDLHPNAKPGEVKYYTFENMPYWAAITSSLVELAGLKDIVEVVVGDAADGLRRLHTEGRLPIGSVDMMLLDHWEKFYVPDLRVCEELGLLREGSVVFADNVLAPGAPEYLAYVQGGKMSNGNDGEGWAYETKGVDSIMPNGWKDILEVTTVVKKHIT